MLNVIMKLIIMPIIVVVASNLLTGVHFPYTYQAVVTGVTLAIVGWLMEVALLRKGTFWLSTISDFVVSAITLSTLAYFFQGAYTTVWGSVLTAALITVVEVFTHLWLLRTDRARKDPSA